MSGRIEMLAGEYAAAEAHLREACEAYARLQMWPYLATSGAYLARALDAQGRLEEADHWSVVAQRHATEGDVSAQPSWRSVRALVRARQENVAAEAHLREACETYARLQMWPYLATSGAYLARALDAQGRLEEADHWSVVAQRHATEGDVSAQPSWRSVRALVRARQENVGAEALAREAVRSSLRPTR